MTGIVTLSGVIVLSNPRCVDESRGNKNLLLDADIWCDDIKHSDSPSVGLFRYFNTRDYTFENTFTVAFVTVNIAKMDGKVPDEYRTEGMKEIDYAYIGDILQLIPVDESVQPDENPFVFLAGVVTEADNDAHTFEMLPNQYVNILHENIPFPAHCFIPDSPKYGADGSRKPKPTVGGFVAVGGFLSEVMRNDKEEVIGYGIKVENVAFLGRSTTSPVAKRKGSAISSDRPVNKRRYNFNRDLKSQNSSAAAQASENGEGDGAGAKKSGRGGKARAKD